MKKQTENVSRETTPENSTPWEQQELPGMPEKEKIEEEEKTVELQIILNKYVRANIAKGKGYETISEEVYRSVDLIERAVKRLYKLGYKIKMK